VSAAAEAERFARYLVGEPPDDSVRERYVRAIAKGPPVTPRDTALLRFALARPRALAALDAGLAVLEPHAELRRRLYLMYALLETSPRYHDRFLPVERGPMWAAVVAFAGLRGVLKALIGIVVVKCVDR